MQTGAGSSMQREQTVDGKDLKDCMGLSEIPFALLEVPMRGRTGGQLTFEKSDDANLSAT